MDIGIIQGAWTLIVMVLFVGIVVWAWSGRQKQDFDAAAHIPFEDDDAPAGRRDGK